MGDLLLESIAAYLIESLPQFTFNVILDDFGYTDIIEALLPTRTVRVIIHNDIPVVFMINIGLIGEGVAATHRFDYADPKFFEQMALAISSFLLTGQTGDYNRSIKVATRHR